MGAPQYEQAGADVAGSGTTNTIPRWTGATTLGDSLITQTLAGAPFEATRIRVATGVDTYAWFRDSAPSGNVLFVAANAAFGAYKGLEIASAGTYFTNGNVGIGTTSPSTNLHIANAATTQIKVQMTGQCDMRVISDTGYGAIGTYSNMPLLFRTNSAEVARIDSSGNVGVGTTSPSTRLHVSDNSSIPVIVQSSGSTDSYLRFINTSNNLGYIGYVGTNLYLAPNNGAGNVGIGTTSPASRLDVAGTITCDDAGTGLKLPATPGNADSQTLDCYSENTWTASDGSGAGLTFTANNTAVYTRVGRLVHARIDITFPSTVNGSNALVLLPFNAIAYGGTAFVYASGVGSVMMLANSTGIEFYTAAGVRMTNGALSTLRIIGSIVYQAA